MSHVKHKSGGGSASFASLDTEEILAEKKKPGPPSASEREASRVFRVEGYESFVSKFKDTAPDSCPDTAVYLSQVREASELLAEVLVKQCDTTHSMWEYLQKWLGLHHLTQSNHILPRRGKIWGEGVNCPPFTLPPGGMK